MTAAPSVAEAAQLPAIGIDIGGTKVAGGVVAPDGTILDTARRATPGKSVSATEDAIAAVVDELADRHGGPLVGVGVGAAGWFDRTGDTVLFSPHLAWRNQSLRKDSPTGCSARCGWATTPTPPPGPSTATAPPGAAA